MATKLTAQQKRDRDVMSLLNSTIIHVEAAHKVELDRVWIDRHTEGYEAGWRAGHKWSLDFFNKLSLWERITWRSR
jgi:hypothetical protein